VIGLDTNVIVRYLTQDDLVQSPRPVRLIERQLTDDNPGFICVVAIAEAAWVLERTYGFSAVQVAAGIERILQADVLVVENEQQVFTAMIAQRQGRGSFADALISALGRRAGCSVTSTFDRKALRLPGFAAA
jgi:predicted nucleic-acid-binding protein